MPAPSTASKVELLTCSYCQAPVVKGAGSCRSCATPQSGKEPRYVPRSNSRPEVQPLFKWWGIWTLLIWIFSGFSLGKISSILVTAVTFVYLFRILRAYYAD